MNLNELKKGTPIRISNGEKQPPKHHTKKLSAWKSKNRVGYFYEYEEEYNKIAVAHTPDCHGLVDVLSLNDISVELA
jgi:hypothetical protein